MHWLGLHHDADFLRQVLGYKVLCIPFVMSKNNQLQWLYTTGVEDAFIGDKSLGILSLFLDIKEFTTHNILGVER